MIRRRIFYENNFIVHDTKKIIIVNRRFLNENEYAKGMIPTKRKKKLKIYRVRIRQKHGKC